MDRATHAAVITGHSRLKDGVASLAYVPVIAIGKARSWITYSLDRDGRNMSGHDNRKYPVLPYAPAALFGAACGFSTSSLGALVANCSSCGIDGRWPLVFA